MCPFHDEDRAGGNELARVGWRTCRRCDRLRAAKAAAARHRGRSYAAAARAAGRWRCRGAREDARLPLAGIRSPRWRCSSERRARLVISDVSLYSADAAYRSSVNGTGLRLADVAPPVGRDAFHETADDATIRSGLPRNQRELSAKVSVGGMSAGLPSAAPLSAHFAMHRDFFVGQADVFLESSGCRCSARAATAASRRACPGRTRAACAA